jgi:hypothetical protein
LDDRIKRSLSVDDIKKYNDSINDNLCRL